MSANTEQNQSRKSLWLFVLAIHAILLAAWWWLTPKGFPLGHGRFYLNELGPILALATTVLCALAACDKLGKLRGIRAVIPGFWVGSSLGLPLIFPLTGFRALIVTLPPAFFTLLLSYSSLPKNRRTGIFLFAGTIIGALVPLQLRAPRPSTQALDQTLDFPAKNSVIGHSQFHSSSFAFDAQSGVIRAESRGVKLRVNPRLTFMSRSPDGFWTVFATRRERGGALRQLSQLKSSPYLVTAYYRSDYLQCIELTEKASASLFIESRAFLPEPIYSHLNSTCHLSIESNEELYLAFSPCPNSLIRVKAFDYPVGRPARLAYFSGSQFKVVEATSGEKGPFHDLASGSLKRGDALKLNLIVKGRVVFELELADWSTAASTELSPTAGWRLPMNAIEFSRGPGGANVWISLAATSVGRGWDSVAHSAGFYRGRMKLKVLDRKLPNSSTKIE